MFWRELLFSSTLLTLTIAYNLFAKIDPLTNVKYDCIYSYLNRELFRDFIFLQSKDHRYNYLIDQLVQYCLVVEHHTINDDSCAINGGIIWTFEQLNIQNVLADHLIQWNATIDVIDRYEHYLQVNDVELSSVRFCNCTHRSHFGTQCQYKFNMTDASFETIAVSHFHNLVTFSLNVLEEIDGGAAAVTCYERDPSCFGSCLDWRQICNGIVDCSDGRDEVSCHLLEFNECLIDEYRCRSGHCIPMIFAFDGTFDCADGSDEDEYFLKLFRLEICYRRIPNIYCDGFNSAWMMLSCGDGHSIPNIYFECDNARYTLVRKMLYTDNVTSCWQHFLCIFYLDHLFPALVNCTVLCGTRNDCSGQLSTVCQEEIVIFPPRPVIMSPPVYLAYKTNNIGKVPADFFCYSECHDVYPPSFNFSGYSCRPVNDFSDEFGDLEVYSFQSYSLILDIFEKCRNNREIRNNSKIFRCPIGGKIISFHRVNDGFDDCFGALDESFDGNTCVQNSTQRFQCWTNSSECIHRRFVQDGQSDCSDISDEYYFEACHSWEIKSCDHRRAIHPLVHVQFAFRELCNGKTNRASLLWLFNGTDETDCEDFWCLSSASTRCNGYWDCIDGRDELNCSLDILPANARSATLLHSLHGCNTMEHFCLHVSNGSQNLTRPCISVSYAGDGHIDCYGATDERHIVCQYKNSDTDLNKVYSCAGEQNVCVRVRSLCDGESSCPLEDDETICPWRLKDEMPFLFYCRNGTSFYRYKSQCNGVIDCLDGEDEWFCDLGIRARVITLLGLMKIPVYPPSLQNITTQVIVQKQMRTLLTSSQPSSWYCNRGIPITDSGLCRCLCPSSYFGERCEHQQEHISLILQIISSPLLQRDIAIKCVVYLIDVTTYNILAEEEILHFPPMHSSFKHIVSLPSVRAKNLFVRIDVYEVNTQRIIAYRASWKFHLPFPFLPVRRLAFRLDLSDDENVAYRPRSSCHGCFYGQCLAYQNTDDGFCHCHNGWTGLHCNQSLLCGANALSLVSDRCLCPMNRHGKKCFVPYKPICHCQNGATCIPLDARTDQSACLCLDNYFGLSCERQHASLTIKTFDKNLPETLPLVLFHFLDIIPAIANIENIILFEHVSTHRPLLIYHTNYELLSDMILAKIFYSASIDDFRYYIVLYVPPVTIGNKTWPKHVESRLEISQQCLHVREMEIFKKPVNIFAFPYIKRIKFYLRGCFDNIARCFHDETYLCFCPIQHNQTGNCIIYNHTREMCQKSGYCLNDGLCIENRRNGIVQFACLCPSCHYYGTLCQFSLGQQGLSLDALVGTEMHTGKPLSEQSLLIKLCLTILTVMITFGLIGNILCMITFARKTSRETGCGYYLWNISLYNQLALIILGLRFVYLLSTQMIVWSNRTRSLLLCQCLEYGLIVLPNLSNWLSACVSIERTYAVVRGALFNKQTSIRVSKYVCVGMLIVLAGITVHEPFARQLVEDPRLGRYTWCITKFNSERWQKLASVLSIIHLLGPFLINFLSTGILLVSITRQRSTVRKDKTKQTFSAALRIQMAYYKHLIISPMVLLILNFPRLVISLGSVCVDTSWRNYVFLAGYLISFLPFMTTLLIFILPAPLYRDEFKLCLSLIRRRFLTKIAACTNASHN